MQRHDAIAEAAEPVAAAAAETLRRLDRAERDPAQASRAALGVSALAGWSLALLAVPGLADHGRHFAIAALIAGGLGLAGAVSAWVWPRAALARSRALLGAAAIAGAVLWGWCAILMHIMP